MEQLQAISASLPVPRQTQLIIVGFVAVIMFWLKPVLFTLGAGIVGFLVWRGYSAETEKRKREEGEAKKKDEPVDIPARVGELDKKPVSPYKENEEDMKRLMKDMKRDQKKRRESDKEVLQKELEEEEKRKKAEENAKKDARSREMRTKVTKELLETERSYVEKLKAVVEVFEQPMAHSNSITPDQIASILSYTFLTNPLFDSLLRYLFKYLEKVMTNWNDNSEIGGVFLEGGLVGYMKLYISYVNNYSKSMETLHLCKQSPQFCTLLEVCRVMSTRVKRQCNLAYFQQACERNPRCAALDLPALLIMPVQRIPRYILLLTEIHKYTPQSHPDYAKLGQALAKLKESAAHINEAKRDAESLNRVYELSKLIDGLNEPLIRPARKLLMEGDIKQKPKAASLSDEWEVATYFLFNDMLLQTKKKGKRYVVKSKNLLSTLQVARYDNKQEFGMLVNDTFMVLTTAEGGEPFDKWAQAILDAKAVVETHKLDGSPNIKTSKK